jgi:tetratricopeptide (TPR) repeat protein
MRTTTLFLLASLTLLPARARAAAASPVDLLQDGLEAMMDDRYEDAVRSFQSALQYDKNNQAAQRGLKGAQQKLQEQIEKRRAGERPALDAAKKAMGREDWPEAVDRLDAVLERQPDHPEALALRQKIRARMSKQFEKAKNQSSDWYYAQGVLSYIDKDWLKAVDSWDQVVSFDPDRVGLVSKIEQAKRKLAAREREDKTALYQSVAFDSLKKGDYPEAIKNWQQLLELDPDNAQAKEGVAEAQKAWGEQKKRNQQEEIQKLSEQAMDAYIERNFKASRGLWNQILQMDPENTLAQDYLRRMQGQGGYAGASGAAPQQSGYDKALSFLSDGRYPEGIEYLERYVAKYPADKKAQASLDDAKAKQKGLADKAYQDGLMTYSQGDVQGSISHWQDALRTDPDYQRARQAIIKAMAEQRKKGPQ